ARFISWESLGLSERCARLVAEALERFRLVHGGVGHHLAVKLDAGLGEPGDEARIGQGMQTHRRIDALDPERAIIALLLLAPDIGELPGALDCGIRRAERVLATAVIALRLLQDFLVTRMRGHATFYASHCSTPSNLLLRVRAFTSTRRASTA